MPRFAAARPRRAGEVFARAHHGENDEEDGPSSKKVKFDVRNPSALAPTANYDDDGEEDQVLQADVIGGTRVTKRNAVNIDGYDSDSENETFNARAEARDAKTSGENVKLDDAMDNYNTKNKPKVDDGEDDDDFDMFSGDVSDGENKGGGKGGISEKKKAKEVRFLQNIEGQETKSKSGGTIRLDDEEDSEDEDGIALAIEEEGVDDEVGLGGLKKHAPKIDAFNMRDEQEEGAFDESGNYIRKAADPEAVHDRWMDGVSKKAIKKAAEAHEKREAELKEQRREDNKILTSDLLKALIIRLEPRETALEALARLGKGHTKPKKIPKWKQKKQKADGDAGATDTQETEDPKQAKIREAINAITEAADKLLRRDNLTIYELERELLIREYQDEAGERWVEAPKEADVDPQERLWEFRWADGRDGGGTQGPFPGATMKAWQDGGFFGAGVEFRPLGETEWSRAASFA
jgi:CD2 antigen cytoplasmic tail-binding protein 2